MDGTIGQDKDGWSVDEGFLSDGRGEERARGSGRWVLRLTQHGRTQLGRRSISSNGASCLGKMPH